MIKAMQELQDAYDTCTKLCSSLASMSSGLMKWLPPSSIYTDGCRVALERLKVMWPHADKFEALLFAPQQDNVSVSTIKEVLKASAGDFKSLEVAATNLTTTWAHIRKAQKREARAEAKALGSGENH